jgi:hypothetical protein
LIARPPLGRVFYFKKMLVMIKKKDDSEGMKTAREEGTDEAQFSCLSGKDGKTGRIKKRFFLGEFF